MSKWQIVLKIKQMFFYTDVRNCIKYNMYELKSLGWQQWLHNYVKIANIKYVYLPNYCTKVHKNAESTLSVSRE